MLRAHRDLSLAVLLFVVPGLWGQTADDWLQVQTMRAGRRIEVRLVAAPDEKLRGRLVSATSDALTWVDEAGLEKTHAKAEISLVRMRKNDRAPIVGAAAGIAVGALASGTLEPSWAGVPVFGGAWYLIGRGIQGSNWKTVYGGGRR
jgi:hypothetical protein